MELASTETQPVTTEAVIGFDVAGHVVSWTAAAEQLLSVPAEDAVARPANELFIVESTAGVVDVVNEVLAGTTVRGAHWVRRCDGTRVEVDLLAAPVRNCDGTVTGVLLHVADVTAERAEHQALSERAALVDDVHDAVVCTDLDGLVTYWSRGAERLYGWAEADIRGQAITAVCVDVEDVVLVRHGIAEVAAGRTVTWTDRPHRRNDGSFVFTDVTVRPMRGPDGNVAGVAFVAQDVSQQRAATLELERLAWQDPLTSLPNRQALHVHLHQLGSGATAPEQFAVVLLDIDHLSLVNDTHGHEVGEDVLCAVAARLQAVIGPDDFLARFGGDEFAVVLRDADNAAAIGAAMLAAVAEPLVVRGVALLMSASAGLVLCPPLAAGDALRRADASMYEAKRQGRARLHVFDHSVSERAASLLQLSGALRRALRDDSSELSVHYQPIVDLTSDRLVALEALARWHHPDLGPIPPGRFVDVAEHTGLAARLDLWTMTRAFADYASLVAEDAISPETRISVNIAATHLESDDVADEILRVAQDAGVAPQRIMIEVTEDSVLRDVVSARRSLERLQARGVSIAVDDFGTGSSSLAHLRQLPVDVLKIDRAFVRNITEESDDVAIVAALVDLAHALGVTVIAEGVETSDQRRLLAELKCEQAQGYLWARPVPLGELTEAIYDVVRRGRAADAETRLRPRHAATVVGREHGLLRMLELRREGKSPATIASALNAEDFRTPDGLRWHRNTVAKALSSAARPGPWSPPQNAG